MTSEFIPEVSSTAEIQMIYKNLCSGLSLYNSTSKWFTETPGLYDSVSSVSDSLPNKRIEMQDNYNSGAPL